jgi:hypothetical protein
MNAVVVVSLGSPNLQEVLYERLVYIGKRIISLDDLCQLFLRSNDWETS